MALPAGVQTIDNCKQLLKRYLSKFICLALPNILNRRTDML